MGKFNVTDWGGVAEILGRPLRFYYDGQKGRLAFKDIASDEAQKVLAVLSLGGVAAIKETPAQPEEPKVETKATKTGRISNKELNEQNAPKPDKPAATTTATPAPASVPAAIPGAPVEDRNTGASCPECGLMLWRIPTGGVGCAKDHYWTSTAAALNEPSLSSKSALLERIHSKPAETPAQSASTVEAKPEPEAKPAAAAPESKPAEGQPDPWGLTPDGSAPDGEERPKRTTRRTNKSAEEPTPAPAAAPASVQAPAPAPATTAAAPAAPASTLPDGARYDLEMLRKAPRLAAVLDHLIRKGYKTEQQMIDACKQVASEVPVIGRVNNLDERIKVTLTRMGYPEMWTEEASA